MLRGGLISTSGRSWQKILCFCVICSGFGQVSCEEIVSQGKQEKEEEDDEDEDDGDGDGDDGDGDGDDGDDDDDDVDDDDDDDGRGGCDRDRQRKNMFETGNTTSYVVICLFLLNS